MKIMKKCYNKSVTCWLILILFCLCSCNNTEKWVNKNSFEEDTGNVFSENKSSEEIIKLPNGNSTVSLGAKIVQLLQMMEICIHGAIINMGNLVMEQQKTVKNL